MPPSRKICGDDRSATWRPQGTSAELSAVPSKKRFLSNTETYANLEVALIKIIFTTRRCFPFTACNSPCLVPESPLIRDRSAAVNGAWSIGFEPAVC
jgi:hypothetical protein